MFGIQLSVPGHPILLRALERGLWLNCTHDTVLRMLPPFILTREQAGEAIEILDQALADLN
jgi:acetylornithine/N-succinyldiaminopimelate aminotransferase